MASIQVGNSPVCRTFEKIVVKSHEVTLSTNPFPMQGN